VSMKTASSPLIEDLQIDFSGLRAQQRRLKPRIDVAIQRVLDHGRYIMGPEVQALEEAPADFAGARHCVSVSSGTDALLAALMALEVGAGDAVFLPAFTFPATAEVVRLLGAHPVFVDVSDETFNIDAADLVQRIEETRRAGVVRPRVVLSVDLFGQPADYPLLTEICERHTLTLLADGAQSLGGALDGRRVGTLAPITTTSFFPSKPLGCYGDGGAVFTDDDDIADAIRSIRLHGRGSAKYDTSRLGLNARLDTLQAAILLVKLSVFEDELEAQAEIADQYGKALGGVIATPKCLPGAESAWAHYAVKVDGRDRAAALLREAGVPTAVYYPRPLHLQPAYIFPEQDRPSLSVSERLPRDILCLPINPYLGRDRVQYVCDAIHRAVLP